MNLLADIPCGGYHGRGGYPDCSVRQCVRVRSFYSCIECWDFLCQMLRELMINYPLFTADSRSKGDRP